MKKMYLVRVDWSCESSGNVDMYHLELFSTYEKARKYFEKEKQKIIDMQLGYDYIDDEKDFYCESVDGEYLYYHELVSIEELIVDKESEE